MCQNETNTIDVDALKRDVQSEFYGAYFCGGFGGAMVSAFDLERVTPELLVETAIRSEMDCIVTRNEKDYMRSSVKVYTPSAFLKLIKAESETE